MKIVSVWNPKGGQGKSLIALNLAAAATAQGRKAIVICRDPQGTSTLFYNGGNLPFAVLPAYPKDQPDVDLVIVDHAADDWIVPTSPIVIIPCIPERSQYATFRDALALLENSEVTNRVIQLVTNTDYRVSQQANIATAMKRAGAFELRRIASLFTKAAEEYRTIFDSSQIIRRSYAVHDRQKEFNTLLASIQRTRIKQTRKILQQERAYA